MGIHIGSGVCNSRVQKGIGAVMDERQKGILDWLREVEPELGELYEGALEMVNHRGFPGRERLICHAVREIRNRLPNAVAGKRAIKRLDYPEQVALIAKAWERAGLGGVYEKQNAGTNNEVGQHVPREVLVLVDELVRRHGQVKHRKEENARRLMTALEPENKQLSASLAPVVGKWIEVTEWFVERAHIGKDISEDELVAHFRTFETVLQTFSGYFYEGFEEIERHVEEANRSGARPSSDEVESVVARLIRPRYRIHFFDKLYNPHWIKPLKDAGFFKIPQDAREGEAYER